VALGGFTLGHVLPARDPPMIWFSPPTTAGTCPTSVQLKPFTRCESVAEPLLQAH